MVITKDYIEQLVLEPNKLEQIIRELTETIHSQQVQIEFMKEKKVSTLKLFKIEWEKPEFKRSNYYDTFIVASYEYYDAVLKCWEKAGMLESKKSDKNKPIACEYNGNNYIRETCRWGTSFTNRPKITYLGEASDNVEEGIITYSWWEYE